MAFLALAAMFFIPAGTLAYWNAWLYLGIIFIPMGFVMLYLLKYDPELLERRMRFRERQATQKRVIGFSWIIFLLAFLIPGFDYRFGWSEVPVWVVLLAAAMVLLSYAMIFWVFRENSYASRVVEVMDGQRVIDSGPYAIVRHPMYIGSTMFYVFSPLVLGSWWALIPALLIIPMLVARIRNEEAVLVKDLPGYEEYRRKVRFRMVPGVW
ncbi:MAG: isoprenylcysteine carboxylmethyltransferase family protein [Deltaproteobacteria bacterium]|nr:MAG: isoprenylcysteine carboxylmethyltransferase family protein [Deltaproteobacteria bacterium]